MKNIRIYEVGPRDGLQNEKSFAPTEQKVSLINTLSKIGFERIEATAFVSPKWVPQMADASKVMDLIERVSGVHYGVLTPNLKGYEMARESRADEVAIFASASETFSQKNINCSIAESMERFAPVLSAACVDDMPVRGYVSCVSDCPYEGSISPQVVANVAVRLLDMGCYEVSLGDTIGMATPDKISAMLDIVLKVVPADKLAGHYHDTDGRALDNVAVSLTAGLRTFDSAIGGLGGCPYAPGAKGNVSTLALASMLKDEGWATGLDMELLIEAEHTMSALKAQLKRVHHV